MLIATVGNPCPRLGVCGRMAGLDGGVDWLPLELLLEPLELLELLLLELLELLELLLCRMLLGLLWGLERPELLVSAAWAMAEARAAVDMDSTSSPLSSPASSKRRLHAPHHQSPSSSGTGWRWRHPLAVWHTRGQ